MERNKLLEMKGIAPQIVDLVTSLVQDETLKDKNKIIIKEIYNQFLKIKETNVIKDYEIMDIVVVGIFNVYMDMSTNKDKTFKQFKKMALIILECLSNFYDKKLYYAQINQKLSIAELSNKIKWGKVR